MKPPRILVLIEIGRYFAHAAYAVEELFRRLALAREVIAFDRKNVPDFSPYDAIIYYGQPNLAPPQTDKPLVHMLASSFFGEKFSTRFSIPEPPFAGKYPSPALFVSPTELFPRRPMKNGLTVYEDYFASTYVLLSGHEERVAPSFDEHDRFHGRASFLFRGGVLDRPLVEDYAEELRTIFERLGVEIPDRPTWPNAARMALCLTSDVDLPRRNTWRSVARALAQKMPVYEDLNRQPSFLSYIPSGRLDPYLDLAGMTRRGRIPSAQWTFFFLAGTKSKLDSYSLDEDPELTGRALDLAQQGMEISLHAPYQCRVKKSSFEQAVEAFSNAAGPKPIGVRQHYLRYSIPLTWKMQCEAGLQYDAGAAFAACEGFRFGTALPFQAFDPEAAKVLPFWIIPLTAMDVTLRMYDRYTAEQALERLNWLAAEVRRVGGVFTFLWHNSSVGPGWEKWEETFDTFIHSLAEEPLWAPCCAELLKAWRRISDPFS